MKHFYYTLSILTLLLTGCMAFRPYEAPKAPPKAEDIRLQGANEKVFKAAEPVIAWWQEFDDPLLAQLIEQSLQANHDVRLAIANLFEARAVARKSGFDRFPTVTSKASYSRLHLTQEGVNGSIPDRNMNEYRAGFDASWELDLFGRVSQNITAQKALYEASRADLENVYVTIAAEVAASYIELRGAQYRLDIADRNAKNQYNTYKHTQKLFNGGRATSLDTSRAKTQLDLTLARIPTLKAQVSSAIYRLSILTGQVPEALVDTLKFPRAFPSLPLSVRVGDVYSLIKRRPDIRSAQYTLEARVAQYNVAMTDYIPTVNIFGSLGFIATNLSTFGSSALDASVTPTINWRAFDLGRVRAQVQQADAKADAALIVYEKTVLKAFEEIQTALSDFTHEEDRRNVLQRAARSSQKSAEVARHRFDQGVDSFLNVLDAERTQLEAEDTLAQSEISAALDLIAIYKALGGGWQIAPLGEEA